MEGCISCTSATTCAECTPGRCWDEEKKKCQSTSADCATCKEDSGSSPVTLSCLTCNAAHFLETCVSCDVANCMDCTADKKKCATCSAGFFKDSSETSCQACLSGCEECSDSTSCGKCYGGKYWDDSTKQCESCPSNCAQCAAKDTCDKCSSSNAFFDETSKTCKSCISKCSVCSDAESCSSCQSGTFFDAAGKACKNCPSNCAQCSTAEACTQCLSTHYKASGGTCKGKLEFSVELLIFYI